jgi:hypothetical protein
MLDRFQRMTAPTNPTRNLGTITAFDSLSCASLLIAKQRAMIAHPRVNHAKFTNVTLVSLSADSCVQ